MDLTPDIEKSLAVDAMRIAHGAIANVFGVLPALVSPNTTGPTVREAQRHLATWTLQPMSDLIAEECSEKLGASVQLDVTRPLQAFDAGGRARDADRDLGTGGGERSGRGPRDRHAAG